MMGAEPEAGSFAPEEDVQQPAPSRRLRRALYWAVMVLLVFGLGVGAAWALQVKPQSEVIDALTAERDQVMADLATALDELEVLRPLEAKNVKLEAALKSSEQHLDLLFVLVDVSTAQLGILQEDVLAAKAALSGTDARLAKLEVQLEDKDAQTVASLRERVALVLEEVDSDAFAARRDLEILANNLLSLERLLFGP
jgi:cell division protein FtsB